MRKSNFYPTMEDRAHYKSSTTDPAKFRRALAMVQTLAPDFEVVQGQYMAWGKRAYMIGVIGVGLQPDGQYRVMVDYERCRVGPNFLKRLEVARGWKREAARCRAAS